MLVGLSRRQVVTDLELRREDGTENTNLRVAKAIAISVYFQVSKTIFFN